ncbi:MAG: hypothetical protein FVQ82_03225 [Planctomycetes bacterium]|nr:hypothetical protein [Planctomycetota bacterium]
MELTLSMKIRIAAVCVVGMLIIGFGAFGLVRPDTPLDAISLSSVDIGIVDMIICAVAAFAAGAIAYVVAYPYGKQIGPLAAAVGLAVWTFRSGTMASLLQVNTTVQLRKQIYTKTQTESVLWLAVLAAGFLGTYAASKLLKLKEARTPDPLAPKSGKNQSINIAIAMVLTVVITQFAITIFAQEVRIFDSKLTSVIGQPGNGQIAFAVILAFAIASFVAKKFFSVSYIYTTISAVLLMVWTVKAHANRETLEHMTSIWPANFFPKAACAILPLQMISFAAIGSIAGYWFAIQWAYSRKDAVETAATVV